MSTRRLMGLSFFAGLLAALGHAPFGLWPVSLAGFALLVWCVAGALPRTPETFGTREGIRRRGAFVAWAGGVGYFALSLSWIVEPFLVDVARHGWMAPFAAVFMAGGLALFWGLAGWVGSGRSLLFAVALAGSRDVAGACFTGFPWGLPAYIWAETPGADGGLFGRAIRCYGFNVGAGELVVLERAGRGWVFRRVFWD